VTYKSLSPFYNMQYRVNTELARLDRPTVERTTSKFAIQQCNF
jgi:hypothetical protein